MIFYIGRNNAKKTSSKLAILINDEVNYYLKFSTVYLIAFFLSLTAFTLVSCSLISPFLFS